MKKKRILYSELAPAESAPSAPVSSTPVSPAAPAPLRAEAATPARKSAPVELARALAAARGAEQVRAAAPAIVPRAVVAIDAPSSAARSVRERVRGRSGQLDILLFRVGDERFAVELATIEEAIDIPAIHHVPEMPPAMLGVITIRGMLTSMYSPAAALGLSLHDGTSALIIRRGRSRVGVVVDEVDDVESLDLSQLRDAPGLDAGDGIVLGVVRQRDALLALLDTDALLAACQAASLLETA